MKYCIAACAALTMALSACGSSDGSGSPVFTPAPLVTPAPMTTGTGVPLPTATAAAAPENTFTTAAAAHTYAAHTSVAANGATIVSDGSNCPTAEGAQCYIFSSKATPQGASVVYYVDGVGSNETGAADIVYIYRDDTGWHWLNSLETQDGFPASPGQTSVTIDAGCANVRSSPATDASVIACLKNDANVSIDGTPTYADGHLWWHISTPTGWIAHENLVPDFQPQGQST